MTLYVKFCGGCNPGFDRGALARETAILLGARLVYSQSDEADACLLISGCSRSCAKPTGNLPHISINRKTSPEEAAGMLVKRPD